MSIHIDPDGIGNQHPLGAVGATLQIAGRPAASFHRHRRPAASMVDVNGRVGGGIVLSRLVDMQLIGATIMARRICGRLPVAGLHILTVLIVYDNLSRRRGSRRRLSRACVRVFSYECGRDPFGV